MERKSHAGWGVVVEGEMIADVGPIAGLSADQVIEMRGMTLSPGLIEGHAHVLLHPYDETNWNDQVLRESRAERVVRATVHATNTLMAGFTTIRDLGSEGAGYADVGIKQAINKGGDSRAAYAGRRTGYRGHRKLWTKGF